jgi:hypothetical protein
MGAQAGVLSFAPYPSAGATHRAVGCFCRIGLAWLADDVRDRAGTTAPTASSGAGTASVSQGRIGGKKCAEAETGNEQAPGGFKGDDQGPHRLILTRTGMTGRKHRDFRFIRSTPATRETAAFFGCAEAEAPDQVFEPRGGLDLQNARAGSPRQTGV